MSDFTFNVALGRVAEFYNRVDLNDPANSALVLVVVNAGAATDTTMRRYDTLAALLADVNVAEVTNTGYARKVLTDTDLGAFTPDDANDRVDLDIPDQTWTAVSAGTAWTDIVVCYDPDTTGGTDADLIPLTCHDFVVTPSGVDIPAIIPGSGFYRAEPYVAS